MKPVLHAIGRYLAMTVAGACAITLALTAYGVSRFETPQWGDLPYLVGRAPTPPTAPPGGGQSAPASQAESTRAAGLAPRPATAESRDSAPAATPRGRPATTRFEPATPAADAEPAAALDMGDGEWGVVLGQGAKYYNGEGKYLGRLAAGDLIDIQRTETSKRGEMVIAKIKAVAAPVVIERRDIEIWPGTLAKVPAELRDLVAESGRIEGRVQQVEADILKEHRQRFPDYRTYRATTDKYKAFYDQVQKLVKLRDTAEGAKRTKIADQLQKMKGDGAQLEQEYLRLQNAMKSWLRDNPPPKSDDDPRMRALLSESAKVQQRIDERFR